MATNMRMPETRRRRRELSPSSSRAPTPPAGEAYYRDLLLQLQSEFARVVTALETRAASLEQRNDELHCEVVSLRSELSTATQRVRNTETSRREAQEQAAMAREETATHRAQAATHARDWQIQVEQLTMQLTSQQTAWDAARATHTSDLDRIMTQLRDATTQLTQEQQRNAHMSQELALLQCRVDTAVQTSRSFEARLQQLHQLKEDERRDFDAQLQHLTTRLHDKKEQNRYLAEALMDKDTRRAVRQDKDKDRKEKTKTARTTSETTVESLRPRSKSPPTRTTSRYQLPEEKKSTATSSQRYGYGGSPLSGFLEDLESHAPTSPTSSASPTRSPRSLGSSLATATATATAARPARSHRSSTTTTVTGRASPLPVPPKNKVTIPPATARETSVRSERMAREMERLRRKLDACNPVDTASSNGGASPPTRWR